VSGSMGVRIRPTEIGTKSKGPFGCRRGVLKRWVRNTLARFFLSRYAGFTLAMSEDSPSRVIRKDVGPIGFGKSPKRRRNNGQSMDARRNTPT
jgi:hypothetical protein